MPAEKKSSSAPSGPSFARRAGRQILIGTIFVGALWFGVSSTRKYVEQNVLKPTPTTRVVLKNRPVWMSNLLVDQIAKIAIPAGVHSAFDQKMLEQSATALAKSPWVKQVLSVRRSFGEKPGDTLEIDAEFRAPIAAVQWGSYYWLVDGEGTKLPEQFTKDQLPKLIGGMDGHTNIRVIEGVKKPPVESGKKWPGDDLLAGIDLVGTLYGQSYADEITCVDVSNFSGRNDPREAHLVLKTRYNTEIRWGRPIRSTGSDFYVEVSPDRKLERIKQFFQKTGRVDGGHAWVEIRFDMVEVQSPTEAQANTGK